jgi:hypothetical protein
MNGAVDWNLILNGSAHLFIEALIWSFAGRIIMRALALAGER